ncbi:Squalene/phytoene synthase [Paracoccus isoporae]|uniref:Squalene/phytoene synthase n=1 Tax=Paracoccus isoporae TaxID=591205 RepID=A0A1G6XDW6_9RHOB|nr:squalene/phytoene synthase family protein [Paracoccus isoporae]SDD76409.1 Squalene/phytoene synthase [Paracoccus isoporae]
MTPDHCLALLRAGDPDRFAAVAASEPRDRPRLATLYAANLEIARAAIASREPLICEMRLQFWADQIASIAEGREAARHEVVTPLAEAWGAEIAPLATLIAARRRDTERQPFRDDGALLDYIDACSGTVMRLAAQGCGMAGDAPLIAQQARGAGLAGWLENYTALRTLNLGLQPEGDARLARLAEIGLDAFAAAARMQPAPPRRAAGALYAGAGAGRVLRAIRDGRKVRVTGFARNLSRTALAFFGRWQG